MTCVISGVLQGRKSTMLYSPKLFWNQTTRISTIYICLMWIKSFNIPYINSQFQNIKKENGF